MKTNLIFIKLLTCLKEFLTVLDLFRRFCYIEFIYSGCFCFKKDVLVTPLYISFKDIIVLYIFFVITWILLENKY